ncbi:Nn.00g095580.m01.CDS01 [Neocucurbitaria sp. VM-36]
MAWPNPFRRRTENTRCCWGYEFEWTDDHLTPEQSEPLKHTYDVLAEECLDRLNAISPPHKGALPRSQEHGTTPSSVTGTEEEKKESLPVPRRDLYALLEQHQASDPKLAQLWKEVHTIPDWVDWEQIERGQNVFYRYGGPALTGLTFHSLLGGMGAARVVETLARTGGFSTKVARGRLFETTQHILQCTRSLEGIQPGGEGFASSIRVRLLHAAVRQRIVKLAEQRPSYFKLDEWGIPINDLDQIATIGTFSSTLIWLSLPRQGIFLRQQEIEDFLALWRYIAYIMGTPDDKFSTQAKAKAMMESLLYYEVNPSDMSKTMANNIIYALKEEPPTFVSADMLTASARWLNGNELGDRLGLKRVSAYYWSLMAGQCLFFIFYCNFYRLFPALDAGRIARAKEIFWNIVVKAKWGLGGTETTFDFKYVPQYDTLTNLGDIGERKLKTSSIEMRNLRALGIFIGVVGLGAWVSVKVTSTLVGRIW